MRLSLGQEPRRLASDPLRLHLEDGEPVPTTARAASLAMESRSVSPGELECPGINLGVELVKRLKGAGPKAR